MKTAILLILVTLVSCGNDKKKQNSNNGSNLLKSPNAQTVYNNLPEPDFSV